MTDQVGPPPIPGSELIDLEMTDEQRMFLYEAGRNGELETPEVAALVAELIGE